MSESGSHFDHFSAEAEARYSALLDGRKHLAWQSIAARGLIPTSQEWLKSPHLDTLYNYRDALHETVWMYAQTYRRQEISDDQIRDRLLPRFSDEQSQFHCAEVAAFWDTENRYDLYHRLEDGHLPDINALDQTLDKARRKSLDEALWHSISGLGDIILRRVEIDRG